MNKSTSIYTNDLSDSEICLYSFKNLSMFSISKNHTFGLCDHVTDYEKLNKIGQGAYGVVYKAKNLKTDEILALKRIKIDKPQNGLSITAIREINILNSVRHPNIVEFKGVVVGKPLDNIFLVMEYCEQDLETLIDCKIHFTESQIKCLMQQLLKGLEYLHKNYIIHRDLKVSNLLLTDKGLLKIADFGLARKYGSENDIMSPLVVTLWYRAPELLFHSSLYSKAIDMWASGCIFGELLLQKPLLPGKTEIHQIDLIIDLLGTPNDKIWPNFSQLPIPQSVHLKQQPFNNISQLFSGVSKAGIRLLNLLLMYDPTKRATAEECLQSSYFRETPLPCDPSMMPSFPQNMKESTY